MIQERILKISGIHLGEQMSKKLTVIVPSYNSQNTIIKCLDSLSHQTYTSFDVYVIDDGSTDSTRNMVQKYIESKKNFYLFFKKNGGPGSARNYGLNITKTSYVTFVDSDDFVSCDHLENMMIQFKRHSQADMSICGYYIINENGDIKNRAGIKKGILNSEEAINKVFVGNSIACYSVNKIYKTDIIKKNNIRFPEDIYVSEDTLFVVAYLLNCKKIIVNNKRTYYYVRYKTTLSELLSVKNKFDERCLTVFLSYDRVIEILPHNYKQAVTSALSYKAWEAIHVIRHIYYLRIINNNRQILNRMFNIAEKNKYKFYKTTSFSLKQKIIFFLVLHVPKLFNYIFLLLRGD